MQRDLDQTVRCDGLEVEVVHSHQDSTGWAWVDNTAFSSDLPRYDAAREDAIDSVSAPQQQEPQIAWGSVAISINQLLAIRSAAENFNSIYVKLESAREKAMSQRSNDVYQMDQYKHRRRLFNDSQREYMEHLPGHKGPHMLDVLRTQVEADHIALNTQDEQVLETKAELSATEYYMQKKEKSLHKASRKLLIALQGLDIGLPESPAQNAEPESARSPAISMRPVSPVIDPLLEDYHQKVGAISWRRERADDVKRDYLEARSARIFRQDHEQDVEGDDEEFEARHRQVMSDADAAVHDAVVDADVARQACLDANLNPDAGRNLPVDDLVEFPSDPVTPGIQSTHFAMDLMNVPRVLSGGGKSSALLSTLTGNLPAEVPLQSQHAEENTKTKDELVETWMSSSIGEDYPFDDRFEEHPRARPIHYARKSEQDLRRLSINPQMMETMPQHIRERLDPRSSMQQNEGTSTLRLRRQRSSLDSLAALKEKRQDSGYGRLKETSRATWS